MPEHKKIIESYAKQPNSNSKKAKKKREKYRFCLAFLV